ncbi:MAG: 4-hydroxythreonine-4-phosphate dehydrogenase PdxA [Planctomycetes bacterium]|nr:4-hydroxythreonine-4-phosphate dehydrogenase PdxA [Planctomycetota bacterium]
MRLAITAGDPAGIGPEIVAAALRERFEAEIRVIETGPPCPGRPSAETGRAALAAVDRAVDLALSGAVDGVVNAPVSKRHIHEAGFPFVGHTEHIAARAGVKAPTMLHVSEKLIVSIVTTHVSIRKLPSLITAERVLRTIRDTHEAMRTFFGKLEPRLAVAGLNPHAGEGGAFGREEIAAIAPAVETAKKEGLRVSGPLGGDTIFARAVAGEFDAVVAMFHDQALAPLKTIARDSVNVTLGLPFVRTTVDHGPAFDIAGTGRADAGPMIRAVRVAETMVKARATLL